MEKIIIYGLGEEFERNREFLEQRFEFIGYSDKKEGALRTIAPNEICNLEFDYILVSSTKYYKEIKEELINEYHISESQIFSVFEFCGKMYHLNINSNRETSITDNEIYPAFCSLASENKDVFEDFRRNPIITQTYEHVTQDMGQKYLDVIQQNSKVFFSESDWLRFEKNDLYGLPKKFSYQIMGKNWELSAVTMRYIKVLQDILSLFDSEKIKNVVEIGGGYGGQCRIISEYMGVKYSLIDLPEALKLAKTFLGKFSLDGISYIDGTKNIPNKEFDLIISNYAFSELSREVQDFYLDKVIDYSLSGYITWNPLSYRELGGYSVEELLNRIEDSFVIDECPQTYQGNCIIIWGSKMERNR